MEIDKDTVIDFLREHGRDDQAAQADQELPDQVDTERDAGLLDRFNRSTSCFAPTPSRITVASPNADCGRIDASRNVVVDYGKASGELDGSSALPSQPPTRRTPRGRRFLPSIVVCPETTPPDIAARRS